VKTLTLDLRMEIPSRFRRCESRLRWQHSPEEENEKTILRIFGLCAFSHSLDPSGHRLGHLVIASITTIKILTVAPELRSGRAWVRSKRLVIWKNDGLLRL
jgi:hypothetical protein